MDPGDASNPEESNFYDFFTERRTLMMLTGHILYRSPKARSILNYIYIGLIFGILLALGASSVTAVLVSYGNTVDTIHTTHVCLLIVVIFTGLCCKNANNKELNEAVSILRRGVFTYPNEPPDPKHEEIKRKGVGEIKMMSKFFTTFLCCSAVSNTIYVSLSQLLLIREDTSKRTLNPYLPQPLYIPFNTRTPVGFCLGFLVNIVYMFYLCGIVIGMDEVYLGCMVQLTNQTQILNDSILKVERRAILKMAMKEGFKITEGSVDVLYDSQVFQKYLYSCLRANVQHHHALLRLHKKIKRYIGACFLMVFTLASVILAMHIVLIMENPGLNIMVNFVVTLIAEFLYTLHYCGYGERLITESNKTFDALYCTPWASCNGQSRQLLAIIMANTRIPLKVTASGFGVPASLETFGSIITTMYQIMNVARGKKKY